MFNDITTQINKLNNDEIIKSLNHYQNNKNETIVSIALRVTNLYKINKELLLLIKCYEVQNQKKDLEIVLKKCIIALHNMKNSYNDNSEDTNNLLEEIEKFKISFPKSYLHLSHQNIKNYRKVVNNITVKTSKLIDNIS